MGVFAKIKKGIGGIQIKFGFDLDILGIKHF